MLTVEMAKASFFDRKAVTDAIDVATLKNLSKWGAFVRTDARSTIRYRARPSDPGQPPSAHKTMTRQKTSKAGVTRSQGVSPLKEFLFFAYDRSSGSVVVGPARLTSKLGNAPEVLERGGSSAIRSTAWDKGKRVLVTRVVPIKSRPFMGPAAVRTNEKLADIWKDSVK